MEASDQKVAKNNIFLEFECKVWGGGGTILCKIAKFYFKKIPRVPDLSDPNISGPTPKIQIWLPSF